MAKARGEKNLGWRILAGIVIPILLVLGRYTFRNSERVPRTGPVIITPNHYSNIDPLVSAYAVWRTGRVTRFLAKASLFKVPVFGAILRGTGQIPVQRAGANAGGDSLSAAGKLVEDGLAIIVYPEGTLTRDPDMWPMRGKSGAVRLALEHDVPIVPFAHWGAQQILPRYSKRLSLFPRKNVQGIFGEPVDLSRWKGKPLTAKTLAEATTAVMQAITALVEELRDEKAPVERWDPSKHGQTEIGRF